MINCTITMDSLFVKPHAVRCFELTDHKAAFFAHLPCLFEPVTGGCLPQQHASVLKHDRAFRFC
jgi:hypothetical protein